MGEYERAFHQDAGGSRDVRKHVRGVQAIMGDRSKSSKLLNVLSRRRGGLPPFFRGKFAGQCCIVEKRRCLWRPSKTRENQAGGGLIHGGRKGSHARLKNGLVGKDDHKGRRFSRVAKKLVFRRKGAEGSVYMRRRQTQRKGERESVIEFPLSRIHGRGRRTFRYSDILQNSLA